MAKGPEITDEVRMLIAQVHREHPKYTNKEIRNLVETTLRERNPDLPKGWPSKFAIDRIMPGVRDRLKRSKVEPNPLDKPWTVYSMSIAEYSIPPEALPAMLRLWYFLQNRFHISLTIREAKWAARLYAAAEDTENLAFYVRLMAKVERYAEEAGLVNYMGGGSDNLQLYSTMTGHVITREEDMRILGITDKMLHQMKEAFKRVEDEFTRPEGAVSLHSGMQFERPMLFEEEPNQKEAQNERKNRRSKNEGRNKKAR